MASAMALGLIRAASREDAADPSLGAHEALERQETIAALRSAMEELPERERHLIERHYFDGIQLDEASSELGLSKSWGSRLHARAIEGMTRALKRAKFKG
jgi:RNA polymerase sigma factor for flagellar operon FliA